jgi:hypothetical protein
MSGGARKVIWRVLTALLVASMLAAAGVAYLHRQEISDHFAAQNFSPSAEVSELADRLDLTDSGRRVFFASRPTLDASQNFNAQCSDVEHSEGSHVLGCFSNGTIHLFKVTDARLDGIVEVTAAHELLHAVFSRLSTEEKTDLAQRLREAYDGLAAADPALAQRMAVYEGLSDIGFANELHSVLGTEVRVLPDWLEQHYAQSFNDRALIIDFFDAYHAVFVQLQARADELQQVMAELRESIESRSAAYDAAVKQLNAEIADLNRRNSAFEFSDREEEFWAIRNELQARSAALQQDLATLQADIARYEEMRLELVQLGAVNDELNQNLNSNLAPPAAP